MLVLIGLFALLLILRNLIDKTGSKTGLARRIINIPLQLYLVFLAVILTFVASMVTISTLKLSTGDLFKNFTELAEGLKSHKYTPIVTFENTKRMLFEHPDSNDIFKAFNQSALVCYFYFMSLCTLNGFKSLKFF